MSAETIEWLNRNIIVGYTDKHGRAWWDNADAADGFENHYPGAIPLERMEELFGFEFVERPIAVLRSDNDLAHARILDGRKAIVHPTTGEVTGIFKDGYAIHQYRESLVENVAAILDTAVGTNLGTLGLLRNSAVGFASVEMPDNITTPEGVVFRPTLTAATSVDGSLATTYKRTVTVPLCDNTLASALGEDGQTYKVKHTRYSSMKLADARQALAVLLAVADDFSAMVSSLCAVKVSDADFARLLDVQAPVTIDMTDRARTFATTRRGELNKLYRHDDRCAPWTGTAYGVLQAWNTYTTHVATTRDRSGGTGGGRIERNMLAGITGKSQSADAQVMADLGAIIGADLAAIA